MRWNSRIQISCRAQVMAFFAIPSTTFAINSDLVAYGSSSNNKKTFYQCQDSAREEEITCNALWIHLDTLFPL